MENSYLGGLLRRDALEERRHAGLLPGNSSWEQGEDTRLFLHHSGSSWRLFTWDGLALLLRGYARSAGGAGGPDLEQVADELRCHYLEHGELAVDGLEGSFTLALL